MLNKIIQFFPYYTCTQGHHDWRDRGELVVEPSRLLHVHGLECHLQAAQPHAKAHVVHVDMVSLRGTARFGIGKSFL